MSAFAILLTSFSKEMLLNFLIQQEVPIGDINKMITHYEKVEDYEFCAKLLYCKNKLLSLD
jgi:hypothetical protein